ncbi:hypothetical protein DAQ1742_02651 [Dickeya aquatica]|uniref:Uncharacterized protein n=1 Tax=Dickeya aquatica TaxID=1401087 RepID=A0A375ABN4_9GAMM|nr:hypothetical protein DAQ1742_02651 [Dickeya aquatica]
MTDPRAWARPLRSVAGFFWGVVNAQADARRMETTGLVDPLGCSNWHLL